MNEIERFAQVTVAVIGDLMLDVSIEGEVGRISPEAPVPVVRMTAERAVPGGAANVAANIASVGARVVLVGIAGQDESWARLSRALAASGRIDVASVLADDGRPTTTKTRILGRRQQIARIDRESTGPLAPAVEALLVERACAAIDRADIVILSDYAKGVLSDAVLRRTLAHAQAAGKRVLADPKRVDFAAYRGAAILTPNRGELARAAGLPCESDAEAEAAAAVAHGQCGAEIVLTRSEKGLSWFAPSRPPVHLATIAREVFDVSGAGDTVIAVLGVALAAGLAPLDAMKIGNRAAGLVVAKVGTATVSAQELFDTSDPADGGLMALGDLVTLRERWRARRLTVGFTNGCFDLVHPGHVSLIRQAAAACDRLIVALNTDASARRLKGPSRPIQVEAARAEVIGALKGVAAVLLFAEDTPIEAIAALRPDVLVKGADYTEAQVVGADLVKADGGRVLLAALTPGQSTTRLAAAASP